MPTSTHREALRAVARLARLLERATGELSLAHYRVLSAVAAGDQRASRLAERLALGRPAVSAAVDSLAARGLLERSAVAGDLRGSSLRLTAAGLALLDRVEGSAAAELAAVVARTAEPERVLAALAALGPALDATAAQRHVAKDADRTGPALDATAAQRHVAKDADRTGPALDATAAQRHVAKDAHRTAEQA